MLDDWDELLPRFVKVFPADYKRVLAERAAAEAVVDERVLQRRDRAGGPEGRLSGRSHGSTRGMRHGGTTRMGELGAFLKIERVGVPYRDPAERAQDFKEFIDPPAGRRSSPRRARAAWSAACRSATTAARSAT